MIIFFARDSLLLKIGPSDMNINTFISIKCIRKNIFFARGDKIIFNIRDRTLEHKYQYSKRLNLINKYFFPSRIH